MKRRFKGNQSGMTLIEIMVVMTILGLISGIMAVQVMNSLSCARLERTYLDIQRVEDALKMYVLRNGRLPSTEVGLRALVQSRILEKLPTDAWEAEYIYSVEANEAIILSYGRDGAAGGEEEDQDISSDGPKPSCD